MTCVRDSYRWPATKWLCLRQPAEPGCCENRKQRGDLTCKLGLHVSSKGMRRSLARINEGFALLCEASNTARPLGTAITHCSHFRFQINREMQCCLPCYQCQIRKVGTPATLIGSKRLHQHNQSCISSLCQRRSQKPKRGSSPDHGKLT